MRFIYLETERDSEQSKAENSGEEKVLEIGALPQTMESDTYPVNVENHVPANALARLDIIVSIMPK